MHRLDRMARQMGRIEENRAALQFVAAEREQRPTDGKPPIYGRYGELKELEKSVRERREAAAASVAGGAKAAPTTPAQPPQQLVLHASTQVAQLLAGFQVGVDGAIQRFMEHRRFTCLVTVGPRGDRRERDGTERVSKWHDIGHSLAKQGRIVIRQRVVGFRHEHSHATRRYRLKERFQYSVFPFHMDTGVAPMPAASGSTWDLDRAHLAEQ